ncbi:hypothetical protein [Empedobacter sp. UBA5039]|uniref:hypothetical protein n=1 Tax=Empedobacter sp. UBA5039 TaxID=1946439 RepID=UPI0025C196CA|nr:hypothetical protein [Empedobacter sp. UBA5039]
MKKIISIVIIFTTFLTSCAQQNKYPGQLEIRGFKIGNKVDTTLYKKFGDLYFPNYLDGWTMNNVSALPEKYKGLPVAIWQLKSDSSIAVTLLDNVILNITVTNLRDDEKDKISKMITEKFGIDGQQKSYEESHPLQSWITYWNLKTWRTKDVIFQIGNSDMRQPNSPVPKDIGWNLVYSDFILENKIISEYKKK